MSFNIRDALAYLAIGLPTALVLTFASPTNAKSVTQPKAATRSMTTSVPSGYTRVGNTKLYYRSGANGYLDFLGHYNGSYYGMTNGGIRVAMAANGGSSQQIAPEGSPIALTINGSPYILICTAATVERQGEYARVAYRIDNKGDVDVAFRFGIYMDAKVGDNTYAPIQKHVDYAGDIDALTIGTGDNKFSILCGSQAGGCHIGHGWFGRTPTLLMNDIIAGLDSYTSTIDNFMEENGNYDSCLGVWWDCSVPAYSHREISFLVGFGDVDLEPAFLFTTELNTPSYDYDFWNKSKSGSITISGMLPNISNQRLRLQYQCDALTGIHPWEDVFDGVIKTLAPGVEFSKTIGANFNSSPNINHVIRFRIVDSSGSHTYELLHPMIIKDVRNYDCIQEIPDLTYNFGEPVTHENLQIGLPDGQYALEYTNNTDVGTAQVYIKGVFPYSIGVGDVHTFKIINRTPQVVDCSISENISVTYDGLPHGLTCSVPYGYEKPVIYYDRDGIRSTDEPVEAGEYTALISIRDGYGIEVMEPIEIGKVSIYDINNDDYNAFMALTAELIARGATIPWDTTIDRSEISHVGYPGGNEYMGVYIQEGKICGLNLRDYNITGEIPSELLSFSNLRFLVLKGNQLTGNVGIIPPLMPNLECLDVRYNRFSDFYPAPPENIKDLSLSGQEIDKTIEVDLANLDFQQVVSLIPSIILYDREAYDYDGNIKFELYDPSHQNDYSDCFHAYLTINPATGSPTFEVRNPLFMGSRDGLLALQGASSLSVKLKFPMGDANFNGKVEITDLQATVNYIFTPYGWNALFNYTAANMWEDDCINVQDLVTIANVLTDYHPDDDEAASPETRSRLRSIGGESGDEAHIYCADGQLIIDSPVPVAAFDAIVSGASAMTLADNLTEAGFIASIVNRDGESHIVAYSLTGAEIPAGRQTVATVTGNECRVAYAMLSDIAANAIPCIAGRRTGIDDNIAETSPTVTISGNEISLYTPTALNGCRWSIYTTSGTLLASGDCNTLPGYTTLCRVPATMTVAVAVVETPTETITTKLAVTK